MTHGGATATDAEAAQAGGDGSVGPALARGPETTLPTRWGTWRCIGYGQDEAADDLHLALVLGTLDERAPVLTRLHSECLTGDALGSLRCDCQAQLELAMRLIAEAGSGVLVYLRQEGRGIGLADKLRAYALQDQGLDTVEANQRLGLPVDRRDHAVGARILRDLGVRSARLLSNNPAKLDALVAAGVEVHELVPLVTQPTAHNSHYLETKRDRLGHRLDNRPGGGGQRSPARSRGASVAGRRQPRRSPTAQPTDAPGE